MMTRSELTQYIKAEALRLGFDVCGIAKACAVDSATAAFCDGWIDAGLNGTMGYLERNREKRYNPTELVEGCRSIIVTALNYAPAQPVEGISHYAQGADYHKAVKDRLFLLLKSINEVMPCQGRPFCDSAPVLERYWAVQAGLGWTGRNHQLIIPGKGSYFFIGELMVDIELDYDTPFKSNHCGGCRRCIENCPTGALKENGFDARECLSYLTIEHRGDLPENIGKKMGNCFYGCDRCQTACPHNRFAKPNCTPELQPKDELLQMTPECWRSLTKEEYNRLFKKSAVERCGYEQLMRNIRESENGKRETEN